MIWKLVNWKYFFKSFFRLGLTQEKKVSVFPKVKILEFATSEYVLTSLSTSKTPMHFSVSWKLWSVLSTLFQRQSENWWWETDLQTTFIMLASGRFMSYSFIFGPRGSISWNHLTESNIQPLKYTLSEWLIKCFFKIFCFVFCFVLRNKWVNWLF